MAQVGVLGHDRYWSNARGRRMTVEVLGLPDDKTIYTVIVADDGWGKALCTPIKGTWADVEDYCTRLAELEEDMAREGWESAYADLPEGSQYWISADAWEVLPIATKM